MMTVENLLRSIAGSYLHFNRVDAYQDLDPSDGAQLPGDQSGNALAPLFLRRRRRFKNGCIIYSELPHSGTLPDDYETKALPIVNEQLERAGVRLAVILDACLQ
jgi:hypothetical protein